MTPPDPPAPVWNQTLRSQTCEPAEPTRAGCLLNEGDRLGRRYLLERRIGAGGMSVVWRAWDEALQRPVAVKVMDSPLSAGFGDRELIRREARAAARIDHPHAMGVFDVGETITSGGRLTTYVVMRLLDGRSLADALDDGPLPWPEAVAIASRVAEVLSAAHAHGVVHRDVTPENVMLTAEGAKLLDFGIAAQVGERDDELRGPVFGTPPYVAPERLHGAPAHGAADIYALGALLFQMLKGHPPYPETTWDELEVAQRSGRPPAPTGVPGLPDRVSKIVRRCLAADPAGRPTAREFSAELTAALSSRGRPGNPRIRRIAGLVAATVTVASIAIAISTLAPRFWQRDREPDVARTQVSHAPSPAGLGNSPAVEPLLGVATAKPSTSPKSPIPSTSDGSSSASRAQQLSVSQARAAISDPLQRAATAGTIRRDVAMDVTQQVDNLLNSQPPPYAERHRQLDAIREGVRTRAKAHDLPAELAAELDTALVALGDALDRQANSQSG